MFQYGSLDGTVPCTTCGKKIERYEYGVSNGTIDWCKDCADKGLHKMENKPTGLIAPGEEQKKPREYKTLHEEKEIGIDDIIDILNEYRGDKVIRYNVIYSKDLTHLDISVAYIKHKEAVLPVPPTSAGEGVATVSRDFDDMEDSARSVSNGPTNSSLLNAVIEEGTRATPPTHGPQIPPALPHLGLAQDIAEETPLKKTGLIEPVKGMKDNHCPDGGCNTCEDQCADCGECLDDCTCYDEPDFCD